MPKTKQTIVVRLPHSFSADAVLKPLGLRSDLYTNLKASMYIILDTLIGMSESRRWRDYYELHGGYPLYSTFLKKICGDNYVKAIRALEASGVIERTRGYTIGAQSKLFNLVGSYAIDTYKFRSIDPDASLFPRVLLYRQEQKKLNDAALSEIKYITKWFDPQRLTLDKKQAHSLIEFYMSEMNALIPDPLPKGRKLEEIEARISHRVNAMIDTFKRLEDGHIGLKKTGKDHRLHSVVSSTKKELRGLLTYDNQTLVSIDIKASQPYLLSILLNPKSWNPDGIISQVFPEMVSKVSLPKYKKLLDALLMFRTFPKSLTGKGLQKTGFLKFPWSTDFYQHLVDLAQVEGVADLFPNRSAVKHIMMLILFNDAAYMEKDKSFLQFAKWFPKEAGLISLIKKISREEKVIEEEEALNFLPIALQRLESYLILEKVCKRITKLLPDAPLIPVHDCIMTTELYAQEVADITKDVLKKYTGLIPGITIEQGTTDILKTNVTMHAAEDLGEIMDKKPKDGVEYRSYGLKSPIMSAPPDIEGDWIVHSRYIPGIVFDPDEKFIHLIDDTKIQNQEV